MPIQPCRNIKAPTRHEVGANLKRIRERLGYATQVTASESLPVGLDTYRAWEQGKSVRTLEDILMIAKQWQVDPVWLFVELLGDRELADILCSIPFFVDR